MSNVKLKVILTCLLLLSGCAQTYTWVKPGASTSEFYRSKSYCQALASGATPMDYSNQGSSTTYHTGTVYGSGGGAATYSGTSTTYKNNMGQAFANLGQSIKRQNLFNDCMRGQGWVPEQEYSQSYRSSYSSSATSGGGNYVQDLSDWSEDAPRYESAEVKLKEIKVLSKPTFAGETLGHLQQGAELRVLNTAADTWLRVKSGELEGYVAEKWVVPK